MREFLIGRDPMRIGALWQEMYRSQYFEGGRVLTAAISAIDIALHDIKGKALGVPVYQLLGGKQRDRMPTFATTIGRAGAGDDRAGAGCSIETGWTCIRLSPCGPRAPQTVYEPRESIAAHGDAGASRRARRSATTVVLGIDYHHRLSVAEAASFCQKMPSRHARLPRGADPRRDAGGLRGAAQADRRALRHRRGVLVASGSSCPTSSAASTSSTASTSAMSAASPRR